MGWPTKGTGKITTPTRGSELTYEHITIKFLCITSSAEDAEFAKLQKKRKCPLEDMNVYRIGQVRILQKVLSLLPFFIWHAIVYPNAHLSCNGIFLTMTMWWGLIYATQVLLTKNTRESCQNGYISPNSWLIQGIIQNQLQSISTS